MAKGNRDVRIDKKEVKTIQEVKTPVVKLELEEVEAQAIADVLATVYGDPSTTRRKYTAAVLHALEDAGIKFNTFPRDMSGNVGFKNMNGAFSNNPNC